MRLPGVAENVFSLEVANHNAWKRLIRVRGQFQEIKVVDVSTGLHIVNGKPCRWVFTNIHGDPDLLEKVEDWVKGTNP